MASSSLNGGSAFELVIGGSSSITQGQVESAAFGPAPSCVDGKRPRGRPIGSKNREKKPTAGEAKSSSLRPHALVVEKGRDVFNSLKTVADDIQRGIFVIYAKGAVSNVRLLHPSTSSAKATVSDHDGHFTILLLSALFFPTSPPPPRLDSLTIFLAGGEGQFGGGKAVGPLFAAGLVNVTAISFSLEDEEAVPLLLQMQPQLLQESGGGGGIGCFPAGGGSGFATGSFSQTGLCLQQQHPVINQFAGLAGHGESSSVTQGQQSAASGAHPDGTAVKRGRGRPPKAKNKDKTLSGAGTTGLRLNLLEVYEGHDIYKFLKNFACELQRGICIVGGEGKVTDLHLMDPYSYRFRDRDQFTIISISGQFLPSPASMGAEGLALYLKGGGEGEFVGGNAVGPLIAVGTVFVMVKSFVFNEESWVGPATSCAATGGGRVG